ncbi:MAG: transposase [Moorea sp. SIO3I7]|uniref:RNA-guided endonuclease InsQ/TnpB family protein n=1 Tax=unclassified Moorena TaxID=2683338 RepID=UPI0013C26D49|nr:MULTISPECIES: transposase [unclassified Moorena]NEN95309.1 transposase [Moorena sp. SIO3I7]NEO08117.1 transposase [Moorena sp. SIO3I8]NEO23096.1 transposase [Moorena sp. SIO4A5]NEO64968.1 transposase [Moorena sp. SIO4G2]
MNRWLDMLLAQYNYLLRDRNESYEQVKSPKLGNYCDLKTHGEACPLSCSVNKSSSIGYPWKKSQKNPRRSAYEVQSSSLPSLKKQRPWYKAINSTVLQQMLRQLDVAFSKFFKGEAKYPRPKRRYRFRSLKYAPGQVKLDGNRIYLPGIGWMRFHNSRPIPDGFTMKSVTVRRQSRGWFVSIQIEDKSVPVPPVKTKHEIRPDRVKGCDLGIRKLLSISDGEIVQNPANSKKSKRQTRRLRLRQRAASRKKKGSNNRKKAFSKVASLHERVTNKRSAYHWETAKNLSNGADALVFEDLNIKGMKSRCKPKPKDLGGYDRNGQSAKKGLNRVISDAAWGELVKKVEVVAAKSGIPVIKINPKHTSQRCPKCHHTSADNRKGEKFVCTECGYHDDADINGAVNIKMRGLKKLGINPTQLPSVRRKVTPMDITAV